MKVQRNSSSDIMGKISDIKLKKTTKDFQESLKGIRVPILTLDSKWHEIFTDDVKTREMKSLEKEVNELLKRQGFLNNEIKDLKKVKADRFNNIVQNMDLVSEDENASVSKVMTQNQELLKEINERIEEYEDELLDLPYKLNETNNKLMIASMEICYHKLFENSRRIEEFNEWIRKVRIELKKSILIKQNCEVQNQNLYSYMHDIFGAEVIDIFDMKYLGKYIKNDKE